MTKSGFPPRVGGGARGRQCHGRESVLGDHWPLIPGRAGGGIRCQEVGFQ